MALNYPGPYQLRLFYSVLSFDHVMALNLRLMGTPAGGDAFSTIATISPNGVNPTLDFVTDNLRAALQGSLNQTDGVITHAELWSYTPLTFDANFVSTYPINLPGTAVAPTQNAGQAILVYRTLEGGVMKIYIQDGTHVPGLPIKSGFGPAVQDMIDATLGPNAPFIARDTSYPFSVIGFYPGQSEALFKRKYRPN